MQLKEALSELKAMGTAQNVKIYQRHGAGDKLFGVSFANLKTLQKKIKVDHALAEQLWETGNTDAQTLALMVADPDQLTSKQADAWMRDVQYYLLGDMLGGLVARTEFALKKVDAWSKRKGEYPRAIGYSTLASLLMDDAERVPDEKAEAYVEIIEQQIHASPNRARHAMNNALIAIGVAKPSLRQSVLAAAKRIGPVEVDHGQTSCKTPDAADYIRKTVARQKKKKAAAR